VKRVFFHIILTIVILDTTSLNQVLKFPSLVSHFIEHKTLNSEISFLDFLSMHYWGEDLDDNDDEKDMKLPFKKMDVQAANFLFIPVSSAFTFKTATTWADKTDYGPDQPQVHYNAALGSLFRPPRS
jgi:hypothetical protein